MKKGWSEVAFTDIATLVRREVTVSEEALYPEVGVRCFGNGLFHKPPRSGLEVGDKKLFRLKEGDFILQVTFAWEGAVAVAAKQDEPFFGSVRVLTFEIKADVCDLRFLLWYFRTAAGVQQLARISPGSAGRNKVLSIGRLCEIKILLPPLAEQQRLTARLDAIEARLTRVQKLRAEAKAETLSLLTGLAHRWDLSSEEKFRKGWRECALGEVLQQSAEAEPVDTTRSYPNIGILGYGRGTFTKAPIEGSTTSAPQLYRVRAGQFIYSRLFAFEGAYALVQPSQDGHFVSNEFPAFDLDESRILPEFLFAYFKSPRVWADLSGQSTGLGDRRQRIHPEVILGHRLFLPPLDYQETVRSIFRRLEHTVISNEEQEITALLPSLLDQLFHD